MLMLTKRLNPFAAILAFTAIAGAGTFFVVQEIFETDFTYAVARDSTGVLSIDTFIGP